MVEVYSEDPISGSYFLNILSNYHDLPAIIELHTGYYKISVYSSTFIANQYTSRFDNPDYSWLGNFNILPGSNTDINATLNLLDTAVTIDFTEDLTEFPGINAEASITYSQTGLTEFQTWTSAEDERTVYFNMSE